MSELKAFNSERIYWAVEQVERVAGDIDSLHLDDNLFYIKYEANKVIAELENKLRHANYKRCLTMARTCRLCARWFCVNAFFKKEQWALKWHKRWLELAWKFKEAK